MYRTIDTSTISVTTNQQPSVSNVFYTSPVSSSNTPGSSPVRIINFYLIINLDNFQYSNDSIEIYERDSSLIGNKVASYRGSDNLQLQNILNMFNSQDVGFDRTLYTEVYSSYYKR